MTLVSSLPTAVEETGGDSWKYSLRVSEGIKSAGYVYFSGKNQNFRGLPAVIVEQTLHYFEDGLCLLLLLYSVVFMNSLSDNKQLAVLMQDLL